MVGNSTVVRQSNGHLLLDGLDLVRLEEASVNLEGVIVGVHITCYEGWGCFSDVDHIESGHHWALGGLTLSSY